MEPMESPDTEQRLEAIAARFDDDEQLIRSDAYGDGGTQPPSARLMRAALNQATEGEATLSRYAIWANTVRDHIGEALRLLKEGGDHVEAERLLVRAHNSLSAFAEIQSLFDPFRDRG